MKTSAAHFSFLCLLEMKNLVSEVRNIILSGPSGVGKNAIIADFEKAQHSFRFVTPITSRDIRRDEINEYHYIFVSKDEFRKSIIKGLVLDWDYTLNNYYGFMLDAFSVRGDLVNITHAMSKMALRIKAKKNDVMTIFLEPRDVQVVRDRLVDRDGEAGIKDRIKHGEDERVHMSMFDHVVKGSNTDDFVKEIIRVIKDNKSFNADWRRRA